MKGLVVGTLLLVLVGFVQPIPIPAKPRWEGRSHQREGRSHHFHEHDLARWQRGRWFHGRHGGHFGWWWIVGGLWYGYPAPIYPYPYTPPVVIQVPTAPVALPAQAPSWYYCAQPAGYYPYVPTCPVGWQAVPAIPPPDASAPPPDAWQGR